MYLVVQSNYYHLKAVLIDYFVISIKTLYAKTEMCFLNKAYCAQNITDFQLSFHETASGLKYQWETNERANCGHFPGYACRPVILLARMPLAKLETTL